MKVCSKGLNDTVDVTDVAAWDWNKNITQQTGNDGRGPENIVNAHVAEEQVHGLVEAPLECDQDYQADVRHRDEDVDEEKEYEGRGRVLGGDI